MSSFSFLFNLSFWTTHALDLSRQNMVTDQLGARISCDFCVCFSKNMH